MQGLKNKIVVVTGAGQGIGKATAIRFANEGSKVVVAEYNSTTGKAVSDMIAESGGNSLFVQVDISKRESVQKMVSETMKKFGRIDVLVNNAGVIDDVTLKKMTDEQFDRVVNVNMKGTFICTQEVATIMREQEYGVILNAASVVALYGNFGQTNYVASKAGIIGMTKVWARELGKYNIRVNAVAPGFIQTDMVKDIPEEVLTASLQHVPLKRMGQPEEVAATYCFLASDDASYITGTVISVDGGSVV
ncbi:MAG: 3-oxoacyl-[acyl-carrier-protein] reductase [Candidatus Marinimicrobia bacterium]|nr:3-oxoacyl-[acyl-carrier-protein] reductase [Candidatus Neomarinimicrobiota bacterium]